MNIKFKLAGAAVTLATVIYSGAAAGSEMTAAEFHGTVDFETRIELVALTDGRVDFVHAVAGDVVPDGTVLVEFDATAQQAEKRIGASAVARASLTVSEMEEEFDRQQEMYDRGSLSLTDYNDATGNLEQSRAELAAANGMLKIAELALDHTRLAAPFDAIVVERNVEPGMNLRLTDDTVSLMTLALASHYVVRVEVPFDTRQSLKSGSSAKVIVQDKEYASRISFETLDPSDDGSYAVLAGFSEPERLLLPGTPAVVMFE